MPPESTAQPLDTHSILSLRPQLERPRAGDRLLASHDEREASSTSGEPVHARTLFLRGSECRFHCVMCDLWQYTHIESSSVGMITEQIRHGLADLNAASDDPNAPRWLKLYNASSFFDSKNVPPHDLHPIAELVRTFERVIVENHPRILPKQTVRDFRQRLHGRLEIAMGLETAEPTVLARLNKQMTVEDFQLAAKLCHQLDVDVRTFVLLRPPWLSEPAALEWCQRSIDLAIECGARHVTIIPVRAGNGVMEWLAAHGQFEPPSARSLEKILHANLSHENCIVSADLWDWEKLRGICSHCSLPRRTRLEQMNLYRTSLPEIECEVCDAVE